LFSDFGAYIFVYALPLKKNGLNSVCFRTSGVPFVPKETEFIPVVIPVVLNKRNLDCTSSTLSLYLS
jgi:hypothetical protein